MQYLVLGANGYIGSYLYRRLKADGYMVVGISHKTDDGEFLQFDILQDDISAITKKIYGEDKCAIFCIAQANINCCHENYYQAYEMNVVKTKELIHKLRQDGYHVIFFSTDNVFDGRNGNYTETSPTHGINRYGAMKEEMERHLIAQEPEVCIFRLSKVVSTKQEKQNIFFEWEIQCRQGQIRCIKGNRLSFVAIEDIYQACLIAGQKKLHGLYNIVGDESYSRAELANKFFQKLGDTTVKIVECGVEEFNFKDKRPLDISMSNLKFRKDTGYQFLSMDTVIETYIKNRKQQG